MNVIPAGSVDMILCDLPYGTTACSWDSVIPFEPLWAHYRRVIKDGGAIVLTAAQPFTSALVMSNVKWFKYCWVWVKNHATGHLNAQKRPMKETEDVVVFCGGTPPYFPQGITPVNKPVVNSDSHCRRGKGNKTSTVSGGLKKEYMQKATGYPRDVLFIDSANGNKQHPTQKPVALMEYMINTYTLPGAVVLDNCMGSGTTGVAAVNLGRRFIGIEKDPGYFEIAKTRIQAAIEAKPKC
jgi:site-specific DNA-methyltransferase (adenine-specific)